MDGSPRYVRNTEETFPLFRRLVGLRLGPPVCKKSIREFGFEEREVEQSVKVEEKVKSLLGQ